MSANVTTLGLAVDSTGVRRATDDLRGMAAQGAPTATAAARVSSSMRQVSDDAKTAGGNVGGFTSSMRSLQGVIALGVVTKLAREFIGAADSAKLAASRLELVAGAGENLATVQAQLYSMAQRTSSAYGETSDTYAKLARASDQLGYSQAQTLRFTESLTKSFVVSGAGAQESAAGMRQLGQALASGVLRGDELNSIMENAPRLAQAIADGLGVTIGKLREMGAAGELSAERVFSAMLSQSQKLDDEFARMPVTVGRAMTQVSNSVGRAVADMDAKIGATTFLANLLQGGSRILDIDIAGAALRGGAGNSDPRVLAGVQAQMANAKKVIDEFEVGRQAAKKERGEKFELAEPAWVRGAKADLAAREAFLKTNSATPAQTTGDGARASRATDSRAETALAEERKKFAEGYRSKAQLYAAEMAKANALYGGAVPADIAAEIKSKYKTAPSGGGGGGRRGSGRSDGGGAAQARQDAERAAREAEQVADQTMRAAIDKQRDAIDTTTSLYRDRQDVLSAYRQADLVSEKDYNTATATSRATYLAGITQAFEAEKALLEARQKKTADASDKVRLGSEIARVTQAQARATEDLNRAVAADATRDYISAQTALRAEIEAHLTPLELYRAELERIQALQEKGLGADAVGRASDKAFKTYTAAARAAQKEAGLLVDYSELAGAGIQQFLGDATQAAVEGNFKGIGSAFESMVSKMLQQAMLANLQIALFGSSNGSTGGGIMGSLISAGVGYLTGGAASSVATGGMPDFMRGGRADGGNVRKGSLQEVNERGTEMLTMGGKTYLMAGEDGYVKSAERMRAESRNSGGNGAASGAQAPAPQVQINVINQGKPAEVESQKQRQGSSGAIIDLVLREVAKDISQGGGPVSSSIEKTYGSSRAAGASR